MGDTKRRAVLYGGACLLAGGLLFAGFGITVAPDAETRLNGAAILAQAGQFDRALEIVDLIRDEHPDNADALVYRATFLAMSGRREESLVAFGEAIRAAGSDRERVRDLRQDRASLLLDMGRTEEFRRELEELRVEAADFRVSVLEGMQAARAGDPATAVHAYERALRARPGEMAIVARLWTAHMDVGRAALSAGRFADASSAFDAARSLHPGASSAHLMAAETRLALEDPAGAVAVLRELSRRTPGIAPIVFRAATMLLRQGHVEGALDALQGAVESDRAAVLSLIETESIWASLRSGPQVQEILAEVERKPGAGLTDPQ